jgi:site-specific DNA-cytosine methylase
MGTVRAGNGGLTGGVPFVVKGAAIGLPPDSGPQYGETLADGSCYTLNCTEVHAVCPPHSAVRRLTPLECERLQGFPDDWTLVPYRGKPAADGPRYRAIGNSMPVPTMRWIGERITLVQSLLIRA